jgi:GABA permease
MIAIVVAMGFIPDQRAPLSFGLLSVGILLLVFMLRRRLGGGARVPATGKSL